MNKCTILFSLKLTLFFSLNAQTDQQLRNPEYLVDQYNQLVAKHNALIEKTRVLITEKNNAPLLDNTNEVELKIKLNEAMAKVATLENQLNRIKQDELKTNTSNQYLDDTNSRLRRQLQELKADEQEISQRNKELISENRRLEAAMKNNDAEDKSTYSKIRNLELTKSTLQRKSNDLTTQNNLLSSSNKKLLDQNDRLERENASLNQKISSLGLDKDAQNARLADAEAYLKSKESQLRELENKHTQLREDLDLSRNEVARLSGVENLLKDRNNMLKSENDLGEDKIRSLQIETDALLAEIESLRKMNNNLKFEVARKSEQADAFAGNPAL